MYPYLQVRNLNFTEKNLISSKYYNRDENYYDSHQYFQILVDGKKYRYQIFSYETVSDDSDEYTVGFEPDETFGKFVQRMAVLPAVKASF